MGLPYWPDPNSRNLSLCCVNSCLYNFGNNEFLHVYILTQKLHFDLLSVKNISRDVIIFNHHIPTF